MAHNHTYFIFFLNILYTCIIFFLFLNVFTHIRLHSTCVLHLAYKKETERDKKLYTIEHKHYLQQRRSTNTTHVEEDEEQEQEYKTVDG